MLLRVKGSPDQRLRPLVNPEPTAEAKVRQANEVLRIRRQQRSRLFLPESAQKTRAEFHLVPGLDVAALGKKYGGGAAPVWRWGFFRVPLDVADYPSTYERMRNESVGLFLKTMEQQGYRLHGRIQVHEGHYPAMGLNSAGEYRVPEFDKREFKVTAQFVVVNAKPTRIELPTEVTQPLVLHR